MDVGELLQQPGVLIWIFIGVGVFIFLLILVILWLLVAVRRLQKRQNTLFAEGDDTVSIENILQRHSEEIIGIDKEIQELFEISNRLHQLAQKSVHHVGFIRFNPFKDVGGNQSFSLALLDGKDNGVVVSSLHTREGSRVYAKPVMNSQSPIPLTEEEVQAIELSHTPNRKTADKV